MATTTTRDPRDPEPAYISFWRERHICTLTTLRPDGSPHVVPVGVTYDPQTGLARVISSVTSRKVRNILAAHADGDPGRARVAVCQSAGRRWATLEGEAVVRQEPEEVADAEERYTERYGRVPRENPLRAVVEIRVTRALGRV